MPNDSIMTVRELINRTIDEMCDTARHPDWLGAVVRDAHSGDEFAIRELQIIGERLAIIIDVDTPPQPSGDAHASANHDQSPLDVAATDDPLATTPRRSLQDKDGDLGQLEQWFRSLTRDQCALIVEAIGEYGAQVASDGDAELVAAGQGLTDLGGQLATLLTRCLGHTF